MVKLVTLIVPLRLDFFAVSTASGTGEPAARRRMRISLMA